MTSIRNYLNFFLLTLINVFMYVILFFYLVSQIGLSICIRNAVTGTNASFTILTLYAIYMRKDDRNQWKKKNKGRERKKKIGLMMIMSSTYGVLVSCFFLRCIGS